MNLNPRLRQLEKQLPDGADVCLRCGGKGADIEVTIEGHPPATESTRARGCLFYGRVGCRVIIMPATPPPGWPDAMPDDDDDPACVDGLKGLNQ